MSNINLATIVQAVDTLTEVTARLDFVLTHESVAGHATAKPLFFTLQAIAEDLEALRDYLEVDLDEIREDDDDDDDGDSGPSGIDLKAAFEGPGAYRMWPMTEDGQPCADDYALDLGHMDDIDSLKDGMLDMFIAIKPEDAIVWQHGAVAICVEKMTCN